MAAENIAVVIPSNSNVNTMKLEKLLCMKGGQGDSSYATNSKAQALHARSVAHILEETLDKIQLQPPPQNSRVFRVVDLGCSSGSNTVSTVESILKHMIKRYQAAGLEMPEFAAFFSDLPSNDFNTLFKLLPEAGGGGGGGVEYFVAGVPGSFHKRLFPKNSVDFFHSAFSLHWLSQVPEIVMEKRSSAYNRGKVFIHGAKDSTVVAYKHQFQTDLGAFLKARSLELTTGGTMFVVCLGRTSPDPTDQGGAGLLFGTHFQDAWNELVHQGMISSEKRDNFNIPIYAPSLQEFREVVEADGSFVINKLEVCKGGSPLVLNRPDDASEVGRAMASSCRSVAGVLVDAHIGEELSEQLFQTVERRATCHAKELLEKLQFYHVAASLSLL
ncbi:Indole-3-acetate O-methyltransferase 1 [Linum grandiflorum]